MEIKEIIVKEEGSNKRIDSYIACVDSNYSRTAVQRLIEENKILVNGNKAKSSYKVQVGDKIEIQEEPPKETHIPVVASPSITENSNYKLTLLSEKDSFISELDFWLVNDDGSDTGLMEIAIGFAVKTKISDKKTEFYVNGNSEMKKYYIKSLDTIAVILDPVSSNSGPIIASFVYKDITYFVELQKTFYKYEDMQNILESFYL